MTDVKEMISFFRETLQKFQKDKDYSTFLEGKKEKFLVKSLELKNNLRENAFGSPINEENQGELTGSVTYKAEGCDSEGNCFSYKGDREVDSEKPDRLTLQKKEAKQGRLSYKEIEQRRKEVERKRKEVEKKRSEGLPTGDYYSETTRMPGKKKTKTIFFKPRENIKTNELVEEKHESSQTSQQQAQQRQQERPLRHPEGRY